MVIAIKSLINAVEVQRTFSLLAEPGQVVELRALNATTQSSPRYPYTASGYFNDVQALITSLNTLRTAQGVYITLQPCTHDLLARAKNRLRSADDMKKDKSTTADNHILQYRWLLIDCDPGDPNKPSGISSTEQEHEKALARSSEIREVLRRFEWPDPIRADSGNGAHLLYRIDLPVTEASFISRVLTGLAGMFDVEGLHIDLKVFNPSRICKLYGTLACKGDDTDERPHRMSKLLDIPETLTVVPRAMLEAMAAPEQPKKTPGRTAAAFDIEQFISDHNLDVNGPKPWNGGDKWVFNVCPWNAEHTDRSAYILRFPSGAIAAGCQHNGCQGRDWKDLRARYEPAKGTKTKQKSQDRDITEDFKRAYLSGEQQENALNEHQSGLPYVEVGGQLRDTTRDALEKIALAEHDQPTIFVQSGSYSLVRVSKDKDDRPVLTPMGVAEIKHAMTRSADYFTIKTKPNGETVWLNTSPPKEVAEQILSLPPADWPFPLIDAIVEIPQIRSDGSILSTPGYDPATHLYYIPQKGLIIPSIPVHPTKADIEQSAAFIGGFLSGFPWVSPQADLANAYGLWLTTIVRQMVRHVPMALINATAPGTGKGLLTDATSLLATGKTASSLTQVNNEEEWDKRITALLMKSATMISIDNVEGVLRSPTLSKSLTMDYHNGRILGLSKMIDVPQRAIWIANGNNIQLGGDMPRRCYPINMALQTSNPWVRDDFKYPNLIKAVQDNRGKITAAMLTLARGWFDAGQPAPRKKLGKLATFTEWVDLVGGILSYAGIDGFLENLIEMQQKIDVEGKAWTIFIEMWLEKLGKQEYTTKKLIEHWKANAELAETLPDPIATWFQEDVKSLERKVGRALAKKAERPYGAQNLRIVKGEEGHSKVATFKIAGYAGLAGINSSLRSDEKTVNSVGNCSTESHIENGARETRINPHTPQSTQIEQGASWQKQFDVPLFTTATCLMCGTTNWRLNDFGKNECITCTDVKGWYASFIATPGCGLRIREDGSFGIAVPDEYSDEQFKAIEANVIKHDALIRSLIVEKPEAL